jgi:biopolymer transport protein TolR
MNRAKNRVLLSNINVVPYVDVMLVLLVIFMITAPLLSQGIAIDLPDVLADQLDAPKGEPLVMSVDREGRLYLNFGGNPETPLDDQVFRDRVSAVIRLSAEVSVFVRSDEKAFHGRVMHGVSLLNRAGVKHVVLVTESPDDAQ